MKQKTKCYVCRSLQQKLNEARSKNDLELGRIAYEQMRDHKRRVKYPSKHGFYGKNR